MVDGELPEELQYYHRICAVTVVSSAFPDSPGHSLSKGWRDRGQLVRYALLTGFTGPAWVVGSSIYWWPMHCI